MEEVAHGLAVERERDIHERDRAVREEIWHDVVHVHRRAREGDLHFNGDAKEVRPVVPGLVQDLVHVELGGLDGADGALFARRAGVPGVVGGEVCWYYGSVGVSERVVDRNVDGNCSNREDEGHIEWDEHINEYWSPR